MCFGWACSNFFMKQEFESITNGFWQLCHSNLLVYLLVCSRKYRRTVFTEEIDTTLKEISAGIVALLTKDLSHLKTYWQKRP